MTTTNLQMTALGMVETRGLAASIEAADAMLKTAHVTLTGQEEAGGGYTTIFVRGEIGAVRSAVDAGVNTDALDNSAGVDCSDHEVNIKIALRNAVQSGALSMAERDKLLEAMTDEVAALVLRDNYQQSQAISVAEAQAAVTVILFPASRNLLASRAAARLELLRRMDSR